MRLYEIFETRKKQDLTPLMSKFYPRPSAELTFSDIFLIIVENW